MLCATCGKSIARVTTCPECKGPAELRGAYVLHAVLGRGANGVTYRAERTSDGHVVAVKEMPIGTMDSVKALELFEREAKVLAQLSHRAIPKYEDDFAFGIGKATALYLVQELVSGETLAEEAREKRYTTGEVWAIVAEIADVLAYLHALSPPVIHRDVKPANVMRRTDGSLCLIDFGSVREAMKSSGGSTVAGTFGYMAPEQLAGRASPASDIYGLGALAVALLTRHEPDALMDEDHGLDWETHLTLADDENDLLAEMLERSVDDRIASAKTVANRARALTVDREREPAPAPKGRAKGEQIPWKTQDESKPASAPPRAVAAPRAGPSESKKVPFADPEALAAKARTRMFLAMGITAGLGLVVTAAALALSGSPKASVVKITTAAPPDIYAKPLAVDVNGDGVEDVVQVVGIDTGPKSHDPDTVDTFGATDGRFTPHVQAIDGATGKPIYSLDGLGESFASNPSLEGKMPRTALAAIAGRLLVVHVNPNDTRVDTLELATGKNVKSVSFEPTTGAVCERDGKLVLARRAGNGAITLDPVSLVRAADVPGVACPPGSASPRVAEASDPKASSQSRLEARFSVPATVTAGPYAGNAAVVAGGRLAFVLTPAKKKVPEPTGPSISFTQGGGEAGGADNTEIRLVVVEQTSGKELLSRPLTALGLPSETVEHVAFVGKDVLLVLRGEAGFVRVGEDGKSKWQRALPKDARVLSYTLSGERAYVHVVETATTIYGFLSKKLRSRTLVLDLVKGTYVRSIPEGPLDPKPEPPAYQPQFEPVTGCACPKTTSTAKVALVFGTSSTLQTGGKTFYGAHFGLDVDGDRKTLAPYRYKRERIAPPRTLEGMVPLAMACGEGYVVFAHDRVATAWSLAKGEEAWTVDLPRGRGDRPTSLGGAAVLTCSLGSIEKGVVKLPALDGAPIVLTLADGASMAVTEGDAGASKADAGKAKPDAGKP